MPKIKLSVKRLKRLSFIVGKEIEDQMDELNKETSRTFPSKERLKILEKDLNELGLIQETINIETFGRNG